MKHYKETLPFRALAADELGEKDIILDLKTDGRFWRTSRILGLFLIYRENGGIVEESFLTEKESDEYDLLLDASARLEGPGGLITYNGDSFALPHLRKKYEAYRLPVPFARRTSVDLRKKLRPRKELLGLPSGKLADIAAFLANAAPESEPADRHLSGNADSSLILTNDSACSAGGSGPSPKDTALSAYASDVRRILAALAFLPVLRFLDGGFRTDSACIENESALLIALIPNTPLPFPLGISAEGILLKGEDREASLRLPLEKGMARRYFPDYKNYAYLPAEGYAVHKSVSSFVAKDRREPATPKTAFSLVPAAKLIENSQALKQVALSSISLLSSL